MCYLQKFSIKLTKSLHGGQGIFETERSHLCSFSWYFARLITYIIDQLIFARFNGVHTKHNLYNLLRRCLDFCSYETDDVLY